MKKEIIEVLQRKENDFGKIADEILNLFSSQKRILEAINKQLELYQYCTITPDSTQHKEIKLALSGA